MNRIRCLMALGLVIVLAHAAPAADKGLEGTWKITYSQAGNDFTLFLIKTLSKEGKPAAEVVATAPQLGGAATVTSLRIEGQTIKLTIEDKGTQYQFEGKRDKDGKPILGAFADGRSVYPATLTPTEQTRLEAKDVIVRSPLMAKVTELNAKVLRLARDVRTETDPEKKAKLTEEMKQASDEVAKAQEEVLAQHADSPAAFGILQTLLVQAVRNKEDDKVKDLVAKGSQLAAAYGPWVEQADAATLAQLLVNGSGQEMLALVEATKAEKLMRPDDPVWMQYHTLSVLRTVLKKASKAEELKGVQARLDKLDAVLDKEYLAKMPPFKPAALGAAASKNGRVVVMELFTGAQCPPCVAADAAFDGLMKTYRPADVILLQYHMHIPGPDPLTNEDTEARWAFYGKVFPGKIRGVPTALFNGQDPLVGGGAMAASETMYGKYRGKIDELLAGPAAPRLTAKASEKDGKVEIHVDVADLANPGENLKLRILLAEEAIAYAGSNGIRYHHHVVRAFPGGVDGLVLKDKNSTQTASLDLSDLRKHLVTYLDTAATRRPFPNDKRPLDFKDLKIVAFVQDDKTGEILQGVQIDLGGEEKGK